MGKQSRRTKAARQQTDRQRHFRQLQTTAATLFDSPIQQTDWALNQFARQYPDDPRVSRWRVANTVAWLRDIGPAVLGAAPGLANVAVLATTTAPANLAPVGPTEERVHELACNLVQATEPTVADGAANAPAEEETTGLTIVLPAPSPVPNASPATGAQPSVDCDPSANALATPQTCTDDWLEIVVSKGGMRETIPGLAARYVVESGVEFEATAPEATVVARAGSTIWALGSIIEGEDGATVIR